MKKVINVLIVSALLLCVLCQSACTPNVQTEEPTATVVSTPTAQPVTATMYQVSPDTSSLMMCYIIKTQNDKLIVIDGGGVSTRDDNSGYLYAKLKEISGKDVPEVEAWFLTHIHDDHVTEFSLIARDPEKEIVINNVYFNFPSRGFMEKAENGRFLYLYDEMKESYDILFGQGSFDKLNGKTVKQGDKLNIDGIDIEILLTVSAKEREPNINDTSLIFRMSVEGQTVLFLGDAAVSEGSRLMRAYEKEYLKSDIVQMAHHGQGGVDENVYKAIAPAVCLWPAPDWVFDDWNNNLQTMTVRKWMVDMGVKYHYVTGLGTTQSIVLPADIGSLQELDVTPIVK